MKSKVPGHSPWSVKIEFCKKQDDGCVPSASNDFGLLSVIVDATSSHGSYQHVTEIVLDMIANWLKQKAPAFPPGLCKID
jgi:hypothetical protein